ncbi:Chromate resistance protein ChrB [Paenibacillus allorhizosphaerae]|uniref:Chromate resistance protein ChrB n=1 Tax=Paenibacillus allorhizosphaerae TaxID=2849866 RepID=UPI001C402706|nr:Chromate resistance protein ChrB [Paenibacillus allorhizosphaerae]
MNADVKWIILSYKVPAEPSTLRVRVWRTLKALGVVYIQQSVCVAPKTPEVAKKIEALKRMIETNSGEALLLEVERFANGTEQELRDLFNKQRTLELEEFLGGCQLFLQEIESETAKGNFSYREVEENEAELAKLQRWHKKIAKRDFFGCPILGESKRRLEQCDQTFNVFMHKVYATEGSAEGKIHLDGMIRTE